MKRLLIIIAAALVALSVTSCKGVSPDFKFALDLTGDVSNAPTAIAGNFDVSVSNVPAAAFSLAENEIVLGVEENLKASDFVNDYIEKNVIAYFNDNPATLYDFTVKGYISESVSGTKFSVDRRFTNKPE